MTPDELTLLPVSATPQERALEMAVRVRSELHAAVDATLSFKETPPASGVLFLVWEYGLEELLAYLAPEAALRTGLLWQRIRGTPQSVHVALAWLGLDSTVEEEETGGAHWFEYQLDPGRAPTREELRNLIGLARLSAPVGTRLSRLFHGYDMRRFLWDRSAWSDGSMWSNHSGKYDPDSGLYLSFLELWNTETELGDVPAIVVTDLEITIITHYEDRVLWDFGRWGDGPGILNIPAGFEVEAITLGEALAPESQPGASTTTATREFEQFSWGSASWGDRNWTMPASDAELGEIYF